MRTAAPKLPPSAHKHTHSQTTSNTQQHRSIHARQRQRYKGYSMCIPYVFVPTVRMAHLSPFALLRICSTTSWLEHTRHAHESIHSVSFGCHRIFHTKYHHIHTSNLFILFFCSLFCSFSDLRLFNVFTNTRRKGRPKFIYVTHRDEQSKSITEEKQKTKCEQIPEGRGKRKKAHNNWTADGPFSRARANATVITSKKMKYKMRNTFNGIYYGHLITSYNLCARSTQQIIIRNKKSKTIFLKSNNN